MTVRWYMTLTRYYIHDVQVNTYCWDILSIWSLCRVHCMCTLGKDPTGYQTKRRPSFCKWANNAVYPKKCAHGFCFTVLCCGYTLTDFPISIRLTSLALWQSKDCPSASKATLMNMDKYFMWIHYERLHNHNEAKHNKTVCIFLGIYCIPILWPRTKPATKRSLTHEANKNIGVGVLYI